MHHNSHAVIKLEVALWAVLNRNASHSRIETPVEPQCLLQNKTKQQIMFSNCIVNKIQLEFHSVTKWSLQLALCLAFSHTVHSLSTTQFQGETKSVAEQIAYQIKKRKKKN